MKKAQIWDPYADFKKTVLPNGLNIYSAYWNRPWVHLRVSVHSGSLDDPKEKAGVAHFTEHMVNERSFDVGITDFVKKNGGEMNLGSTGPENTCYHFTIPAEEEKLLRILNYFGRMMLMNLEPDNFTCEQKVVLNEFYRKYPIVKKYELVADIHERAFVGTRLHGFKLGLGTPETISSMTMDDLNAFFALHYVPGNMSIIAMGGIEHEELVKIISQSFFSTEKIGKESLPPQVLDNIPYPEENEQVLIASEIFPDLKFELASMDAYAMIPGSFPRKALSILWNVMKEFLFIEIRKKTGSTYSPHLGWQFMGGSYWLNAEILLSQQKLEEIGRSILHDALKFARSKEEFEQKREYCLMSYVINDLSMKECCEKAESGLVEHGRIITATEEMELCEKITYAEYCDVIDYLLDKRRWWTRFSLL